MHCIRLPRRSTAAFVTVALLALYLWVDVAQKLLYGDGRPSAKALLAKYYKCWYQSESSVPVDTSDANNCLYGLRVAAASDEVAQRANHSLRYFFPGPLHADSDPCQNGTERCVVAFGIYGNDSFYLEGGYRNVLQAKQYWPGWKLRFYTDHTLPKSYVQQLTTATSEVVVVDGVSRGPISGMFWRFFVMNDPTVDRFIVRDIDSNPGSRERAAMDEWVLSGRQWHLFRDHPDHTHWPIIGCCFGAVNKHTRAYTLLPGQLQQNGTLLYDDVEGRIRSGQVDHMMQYKGGDQDFLKRYIYPLIDVEHELISHDSYHCLEFASTKAWPIRRKGPREHGAYRWSSEEAVEWSKSRSSNQLPSDELLAGAQCQHFDTITSEFNNLSRT